MYTKAAKEIADIIIPRHGRPNGAFSPIRHVAERTKPMAVPNEQMKQRINFESSAKPRFMTSKSHFLIDDI